LVAGGVLPCLAVAVVATVGAAGIAAFGNESGVTVGGSAVGSAVAPPGFAVPVLTGPVVGAGGVPGAAVATTCVVCARRDMPR
jgi:hypothetical protein